MTLSRDRRRDLAARVGAWLLALPFAVSTTVLPWGRDQGIYAHAASRLLDGYLPYSETFVFKPPATIFVHAAAMALLGRDMLAIRVFDVVWTCCHDFVVVEGSPLLLVASTDAPSCSCTVRRARRRSLSGISGVSRLW